MRWDSGKTMSLLSHKYQAPISIIKGYPDLSDDVKNTPADVLLLGDGALLYELSFWSVNYCPTVDSWTRASECPSCASQACSVLRRSAAIDALRWQR